MHMIPKSPELADLIAFRRDLHQNPELGFDEHRTSDLVARQIEAAGLRVHRGLGRTGVVGTLTLGSSGRAIGLRADMDALPIAENSGLDYASLRPNICHACGHDGHTAMLLGAARQLARRNDLNGTVHFIFQPAEEGLGGAREMVRDGLFDLFPCERIYGLHNWPDLPLGTIATRAGPIMAAADKFQISFHGVGGHAATPRKARSPLPAAAEFVRQVSDVDWALRFDDSPAVVSVTKIAAGHTHNVIPAVATVLGTVRTFDPAVQDAIEGWIAACASDIACAFGVEPETTYTRYYPATINDSLAASAALTSAARVGTVISPADPSFISEDFAFMLQARPGAYIWLGVAAGNDTKPLHHPQFDFNDEAMGIGIALFVALVEDALA